MENIFDSYPDYQPDQLLTSDNLNRSTDFVEQQERLTRFGFTQNGIMNGLTYQVNNDPATGRPNSITINDGFGACVEGYFMHHDFGGSQTYTLCKSYSFINGVNDLDLNYLSAPPFTETGIGDSIYSDGVQAWELLPAGSTDSNGLVPLSQAVETLKNTIITLFLEITDQDSSSCSPGTCDNNGKQKQYRVVPLLIVNANGIFPQINTYTPDINYVRIKRAFDLHTLTFNFADTTPANINAAPFATYNTLVLSTNKLNTGNKSYLSGVLQNTLLNIADPVYSPGIFANTPYRDVSIFNNLDIPYAPPSDFPVDAVQYQLNTGLTLGQSHPFVAYQTQYLADLENTNVTDTTPPCPFACQSFIDFNDDLELAINEFIKQYNLYNNKYFTTYPNRKRRFLVLGAGITAAKDIYRYYSIKYYESYIKRKEASFLSQLYTRIWVMIKKYADKYDSIYGSLSETTYSNASAIRIIPSRWAPSKLGERAIPWYYNYDNELLQYWRGGENQTPFGNNIYNYNNLNVLEIGTPDNLVSQNINEHDFYRIEGVIGCNVDDARQNLLNQMRNLNLPFFPIALEWTLFLRINKLLANINTFYAQLLLKSKTAPSNLAGNIAGLMSLVISNMNVNAFSINNLYVFALQLIDDIDPLNTLNDSILTESWISNNIQSNIMNLINYVAPGYDPYYENISFTNLLYTFDGMEHIGGVKRGGTYVMVYVAHQSTGHKMVVADFQLPFAFTCTGLVDPVTPTIQNCPESIGPVIDFVNQIGVYYANIFENVQTMFSDYNGIGQNYVNNQSNNENQSLKAPVKAKAAAKSKTPASAHAKQAAHKKTKPKK